MIVDIALGSNVGDRLAMLQGAVDGFSAAGFEVVATSAVYETTPVGGPPQGDYLNAVVRVRTERSPLEVLALARELEAHAGRVRALRWGPRTLDVDLLRCSDDHGDGCGLSSDDPELTLPHPLMHKRAFVLVPLADIDPTVDPTDEGVSGSAMRRTNHRLRA